MKVCNRCSQFKPLEAFSNHKAAADGKQGNCKDCAREIQREWREGNPEKSQAKQARYRAKHGSYRNKDKVKAAVRRKVRTAIEQGVLIRPEVCSGCGEGGEIQGHHEDYSKPLTVTWLCVPCHGNEHRIERNENV